MNEGGLARSISVGNETQTHGDLGMYENFLGS